jgi:hypothetical protein
MRMAYLLEGAVLAVGLMLKCWAPSGRHPPKPGTPEFFREAAQASFSEGDLAVAQSHLEQLTLSGIPHRKEAEIWLMVLSAGMARGAIELADILDEGLTAAGMEQVEFARQATAARRTADQHAMHQAELVHALHGEPGQAEVRLAFKFPAVDAKLPADAELVRKGVAPPAAGTEIMRLALEWRGLALTL